MKSHVANTSIRADVTHLHIIQDYGNLQTQIDTKLNSAWGTRTWLTANAILRTNGSGVESADAIDSLTPTLSDTIILQRAWSIGESPLSSLQSLLSPSALVDQQYIAWEALAAGDSVFAEGYSTFASATNVLNISDVTANTRIFFPIFGNGVAMTTFKLALRKAGTPAQNLNFRIETDNGSGLPTGTLFNANWTATIAQWSLTTSFADTTLTLAGSITIPNGQLCHIVMYQGTYGSETINNTNYYQVGSSLVPTRTRSPWRYTWSAYIATWINETPTWTWDSAGGSATFTDTTLGALKSFQITSLTKTTWYAWTTCTITQWTASQVATFSWDIATFSTPFTIYPWNFTIRLSAWGSISIRIRATQSVTTPLFTTNNNVNGIADFTAREIFSIPYVSTSGAHSIVVSDTSARLSTKIGSYPSFATWVIAKWATATRAILWEILISWIIDNTLYYISDVDWAISTAAGIVSSKVGKGFGSQLFIDKNAT
jgi:hypothetical protein